ncbi:T9SS type A sorting domain-containing protein [Bacteroidota bacterium]
MKKITLLITSILLISNLNAQNIYSNPEHVVFDQEHERYLVTNYGDGSLIAIDLSDNSTVFTTDLTECLGMTLYDNKAYISCLNEVKVVDLETGNVTNSITLSISSWLDGIACDSEGNFYVIEVGTRRIYKISNTFDSYELVVSSGLDSYTQDVVFDETNNRLLVVCWSASSPIYSVSLDDYSFESIPNTNVGYFDGIEIDSKNNVFVSSHTGGGKVYLWKNNFSDSIGVISTGYNEPAGLCFNERDTILAIPSFGGNTVDFIDVNDYFLPIKAEFTANPTNGNAPLIVTFTDESKIETGTITSWEWDFDNNGTIDSETQSPTYEYQESGLFSVSLKVSSNEKSHKCIKPDIINITSTTNIKDNSSQDFNVYPNPTSDVIAIEGKDVKYIEIRNINSQLIKKVKVNNFKTEISLEGLSKGVYIINIITNKGFTIRKVILE